MNATEGNHPPIEGTSSLMKWTAFLGGVFAVGLSACCAVYVLGFSSLNPSSTQWIWGDLSLVHMGWVQFLSDPNTQWTSTKTLSYPLPLSISLLDPMPVFLLIAEFLQITGSIERQYLGLYFLICTALQALFAYLLLDKVLRASGARQCPSTTLVATAMAVVVATLPSTFNRFQAHTALSSHWTLLLSLWITLHSLYAKRIQWILMQTPVTLLITGVNPYLSIISVGSTLVIGAAVIKSEGWREYSLRGAISLGTMLVGFWLFGFLDGASKPGSGYGFYSMNFLGPIDSNGLSRLLPIDIADPTGGQTWEGFNYLGAGVVLLIFFSLPAWLARHQPGQKHLRSKIDFPLNFFCLAGGLFFLGALSNRVSFSSYVFEVPVFQHMLDILGRFRASGRLFWISAFILIICSISVLADRLKPGRLAIISVLIMIIQLVDIQPIGLFTRNAIESGRRLPPLDLTQKKASAIFVHPP